MSEISQLQTIFFLLAQLVIKSTEALHRTTFLLTGGCARSCLKELFRLWITGLRQLFHLKKIGDEKMSNDDVIGFTMNYTDPGTGQNLPNAWITIENISYGQSTLNAIATSIVVIFDIYIN